jgi:hypothetical protein
VDFTVTTSKGTLSMPIAKDAAIPYEYASEVKAEIDGVSSRIKSQEDRHYTIEWDTEASQNVGGDEGDNAGNVTVPIAGKHDICVLSETLFHTVGSGAALNPPAINVISSCKVTRAPDDTWSFLITHTKGGNNRFYGGTQVECAAKCGTIK